MEGKGQYAGVKWKASTEDGQLDPVLLGHFPSWDLGVNDSFRKRRECESILVEFISLEGGGIAQIRGLKFSLGFLFVL